VFKVKLTGSALQIHQSKLLEAKEKARRTETTQRADKSRCDVEKALKDAEDTRCMEIEPSSYVCNE